MHKSFVLFFLHFQLLSLNEILNCVSSLMDVHDLICWVWINKSARSITRNTHFIILIDLFNRKGHSWIRLKHRRFSLFFRHFKLWVHIMSFWTYLAPLRYQRWFRLWRQVLEWLVVYVHLLLIIVFTFTELSLACKS